MSDPGLRTRSVMYAKYTLCIAVRKTLVQDRWLLWNARHTGVRYLPLTCFRGRPVRRLEQSLARTQDLRKLLLCRAHRPVDVSSKDSPLEHRRPRTIVVVDQLILMDAIDGFPDAHLVGNEDIAIIKLAILVVGQVCTHRNTASFSELLDLCIIGQTPVDEIESLINML